MTGRMRAGDGRTYRTRTVSLLGKLVLGSRLPLTQNPNISAILGVNLGVLAADGAGDGGQHIHPPCWASQVSTSPACAADGMESHPPFWQHSIGFI